MVGCFFFYIVVRDFFLSFLICFIFMMFLNIIVGKGSVLIVSKC